MQIQTATFELSAPDFEGCPESDLTEFAFIGRSNVGKSSLLNMLTRKKDLAVVSSKPGRTRLINFFLINRKWTLVDLPGYGYAKAAGHDRKKFQQIVTDYLLERPNLSCVFVLIDSRHSPQRIDLEFTGWLAESGVPFVLVFTKSDKSKPGAIQANIEQFKEQMVEFFEGEPRIFICSSKTESGRGDLLQFIDQALRAEG
ncbi:YihA family ribosome biogenesis GTP-binding protein [Verrucomicrobiaceae bacterium R5-34]|uniref:Probable GTP-binding protein EngB n=1 Tax=Oceaniferula flava TaxID=2800421 RepID=A0AAE2SE72_9BACT|nr:ribosome biogenesis GTP-binding protein YihA/YsxC [Oceaniferula flavus]MBK1830911.1 YihA family ribosome biogenesis GTP-binding protein [Verrucomicrobiaceae bacterium R5-34]MBK1855757.1 YihA family ribosome biogenesis GTP-binding protein [Oceaniferula flavus]MBM1137064.1 YihA family ribosome biogenesis GTP-binding protein [Oceaniferula flavus]